MNRKIIYALQLLLISYLFIGGLSSCNDQFEKNQKYQRPEWLVGKIYTQIASRDDSLALFAECMRDVGYDSIVNKSGAYAAFVPHDDAMRAYLSSNQYSSVADIPKAEKLRMVKYHLVQMPWNMNQLQGLSARGWISENDISNNKPFAFKRQTLLRNENKAYPVKIRKEGILYTETIVAESQSNATKTVYTNSRKYVPLFFDDYLAASNISANDYSFYFGRDYEYGNIYYAGARIVSDEIFSDNGFIYIIDKVVEPLKNVEECIEQGIGEDSYLEFKKMINENSSFEFNAEATYSQEGADEGLEVDELFDLTYPGIQFDMHQELTTTPSSSSASSVTMENHYGMVVPTDKAFQKFVDEVLKANGRIKNIEDIPSSLKQMIINSHMSELPIYEQEVMDGFFNAEGDLIKIDPSTIVQKEFASNATFIGVDEMIVPKALSSVSGVLYLDPDYLSYLMAMHYANLLGALKTEDINFSLFVIPEQVFVYDLSLQVEWRTWRQTSYKLTAYSFGEEKTITLDKKTVAEKMFNQIGIEPLIGIARKEFIETLNQKHIVVDNENQTISGGANSVFGYFGDSTITAKVNPVDGDFYNGKVYEIDAWLNFPTQNLLTKLDGTKYFDLLIKAGLASKYELRFTNETDRYTVFLPSDNALENAKADSLEGDHLKQFLLAHILKDELVFTDGRREQGAYRTLNRPAGNSTFFELNIQPGIDEISILDQDFNPIVNIPEEEGKTNIITTKSHNDQVVSSAVIHKIDTVLYTGF